MGRPPRRFKRGSAPSAARRRPEIASVFTGFRPGVPQLEAEVDRAKSKALGVPLSDVFETLQIFLGSLYVNDFNAFGRVWRVQLQAEPSYRAEPADIQRLHVRSEVGVNGRAGQMIPLSTLVTVQPVTGPDSISHFNLYRSAEIGGVKVLVDPKSLPYLEGTQLDFVREGLNEGFKFNNPNEKDRCGCGESFRV